MWPICLPIAKDLTLSFFFAELLQSGCAKVILNNVPVAVGQIAKLERKHVGFPNQCRSQPGAESEKQHPPAAKTAKGLHGRVVDDADRFAQRFLEIAPCPSRTEMFRFAHDAAAPDWRWKSHRDGVEAPILQ